MSKKIFLSVMGLIILLPLIMWLLWYFKEPRKLNILILDKTVLTNSVQEHISLSWLINNEQYYHTNFGAYDRKRDYYGFFPDNRGNYRINDLDEYTLQQLNLLSKTHDVAFYTDLYGIYTNEWVDEYYPEKINDERFKANRSGKMYGGMSNNDLTFLKLMKSRKKLIINEFNMIASPTSNIIRREYEKEFHIKWTGWVGRYYDNLDTLINLDIPRWLIRNYMKDNHNTWPFKNSGIAFVRDDDKVVILENKTHLDTEIPYIYTNLDDCLTFHIPSAMKYPFWFDIISADSTMHEISKYEIGTNLRGDSLLNKWNIPREFPALVKPRESNLYYYMAGDFSDNPIDMKSSYFRYVDFFSFITLTQEKIERNSFFWNYYRPLIKNILTEYQKTVEQN